MNLLLTGASGFFGRHVVSAARAAGHAVDAVVRPGSGLEAREEGLRSLVPADLAEDLPALDSARWDAVVHLAGQVARGGGPQAVRAGLAGTVGLTLPLLQALAASGFRGRVVVATSAAKYGRAARAGPVDETAGLDPLDAYGFAKAELSRLLSFLAASGELAIVEAVPFNAVGKGQPAALVPAAFARRIAALPEDGGTIDVGATDTVRDFVDAADIARALVRLAEAGEPGKAYNIASGVGRSVESLLEGLAGLSARPFAWRHTPRHATGWDLPRMVGRAERLAALGWRPTVPIEQSLAACLADAGVPLARQPQIEETESG